MFPAYAVQHLRQDYLGQYVDADNRGQVEQKMPNCLRYAKRRGEYRAKLGWHSARSRSAPILSDICGSTRLGQASWRQLRKALRT